MHIELPEDLSRIQKMLILEDSGSSQRVVSTKNTQSHVLFAIPCQQRQIQDQSHPVPVDEEKECQESVDGSFGDDVGVEAVAEVDRVDVIAGAKLALV